MFAFVFLVSSSEKKGQHMRILAHITEKAGSDSFLEHWCAASDEEELREVLLREDHYLKLTLSSDGPGADLVDRPKREADLPGDCLLPLLRREGDLIAVEEDTVLKEGDQLLLLGEPEELESLRKEGVKNSREHPADD